MRNDGIIMNGKWRRMSEEEEEEEEEEEDMAYFKILYLLSTPTIHKI
jgi:hypothetical protein